MIELSFLGYAAFGALVRGIYGIYSAYSNYQNFDLSWTRIIVEFAASVIFGLFGAIILNEMGFWKVGANIVAILAGLLGANIIGVVTKKLGVSKLNVNIVEKVEYPDLNMNQQRAMNYLLSNGKITSGIYQQINQTPRGKTKWELNQMVLKGYVRIVGSRKASYYKLARRK